MTNAATTLQNLIDLVRFRTNTEQNQIITDPELIIYLNASLSEMDDLLISRFEDYKLSSTTATIAGNLFSIPADFLKLRGFERQLDGSAAGHWQTLKRFNFQERNRNATPVRSLVYGRLELVYRLVGQNVMITPADSAAGAYQLWYTPKFTNLVLTTDALPTYMDSQAWHEYAVTDCAIKVLAKQNLDPAIFMAQKEALKHRLISACNNRDAGSPKKIINTRSAELDRFRPY
jgi:hypothetical protein